MHHEQESNHGPDHDACLSDQGEADACRRSQIDRTRHGGRTCLVDAEPHRHELKRNRNRPIDGLEHERRQHTRLNAGNQTKNEPDLSDGCDVVGRFQQDQGYDLAGVACHKAEDAIAGLPDVGQSFAEVARSYSMAHQPLDGAAHNSPARRDDPDRGKAHERCHQQHRQAYDFEGTRQGEGQQQGGSASHQHHKDGRAVEQVLHRQRGHRGRQRDLPANHAYLERLTGDESKGRDVADGIAREVRGEHRSERQMVFRIEAHAPRCCSDEGAYPTKHDDNDDSATDAPEAVDDCRCSRMPHGPGEQDGATQRGEQTRPSKTTQRPPRLQPAHTGETLLHSLRHWLWKMSRPRQGRQTAPDTRGPRPSGDE